MLFIFFSDVVQVLYGLFTGNTKEVVVFDTLVLPVCSYLWESCFKTSGGSGVGVVGHCPWVTHYMVMQQNYFTRNLQLSAYWLDVSPNEAENSKTDYLKLVDAWNIPLQVETFTDPWSPNASSECIGGKKSGRCMGLWRKSGACNWTFFASLHPRF